MRSLFQLLLLGWAAAFACYLLASQAVVASPLPIGDGAGRSGRAGVEARLMERWPVLHASGNPEANARPCTCGVMAGAK